MSLADRIAASSRRPTATVRVGGARWDDWLTLATDESYGGNIGSGGAVGRAPPSGAAIGTPIQWSWGYDGYEEMGFTGVVSGIDTDSYPNRVSLTCADPLWKASRQQKDIATSPLNSIPASAAITQILSSAGLTRISIPALAASGSAWSGGEWIMGTLTPVAFKNSTALAAAQRIAESLGYWLYADASGVARAVLLERRPSDSPFRTLRWGVDFLFAGTPSRSQPDTRKNRIVVRGANTGVGGAQIWDAWQDDPGDRGDERTFELIEYVNESEAGAASITGVARRLLRLLNRDPNIIDIPRLKADPRLRVGMTIAVDCERLSLSNKPFFIYKLSTKLDRLKGDFAQSLTLDGGVGSQGYTTLPPPLASFSWRLMRETLNGVGVVEVFLDGTGSHSLGGGEIVSYAWTTATAVAAGYASAASGAHAMFVCPAATVSADITLTVTDTSSKTGSIALTVPLAGDETTPVTTRTIIIPLGSAVAVTPDGGATWRVDATGDAILTPETGGDTLVTTAGSGGTALRTSADGGVTWADGAALGGAATAMDRTVGAERLWVAVGADLYLSTDKGATKTLWGTLPATIGGVIEDPAVRNSVFVLAGADVMHSTLDTPGTAWATLYAGPAGAAARQMARGASGATTWVAYTGSFIGSPLQRVEGPIAALFPLDTDPPVTEIRALALSPDELQVFAWDAQGRGWAVESATGVATARAGAALPAGATAMHARHDPDDSIVYLASFGASAGTTFKYLPLADTLAAFYVPSAGQQSHRVGLGGPPLPTPGIIVLPTSGVSGASDGVWVHDTTGWRQAAAPIAAAGATRMARSPFDDNEWIWATNGSGEPGAPLLTSGGQSAVWRTADAGATWTPVTLICPAVGAACSGVTGVHWLAVGGWAVVGAYGEWQLPIVWRPAGASAYESAHPQGFVGSAGGQDGEVVLAARQTNWYLYQYPGLIVSAGGGGWAARITIPDLATVGSIAVTPGARAIYGIRGGVIQRADDYRAGPFASIGVAATDDGDGRRCNLLAAPDGVWFIDGAGAHHADAGGAITSTCPLGYPDSARLIGNADGTLAAVQVLHGLGGGVRLFDGATWAEIAYPAGLDGADFGEGVLL